MYNSIRGFHLFKNNFESKNSNYQQIVVLFIICIIKNSTFRIIHAYNFLVCPQGKKYMPYDNFALRRACVFFLKDYVFINCLEIRVVCTACHTHILLIVFLFGSVCYSVPQ